MQLVRGEGDVMQGTSAKSEILGKLVWAILCVER